MGHLSPRGLHKGDLETVLLYGDPERYVKALEWASVSIVASLLWNMEGRPFLRAF
jgi:hypothetical protein